MSRHGNTVRRPTRAALVLGVALALAVPVHGASADGGAITDGNGTAAIVGVVTRIPAEVTGGALYTSSAVTLDKARARASGFFGGELVDAFLKSSLEQYEPIITELDAQAENPAQSSSEEEEVTFDSPETDQGRVGYLRAAAPSRTRAEAILTLASDSGGEAPLLFDGVTAETTTEVLEDDTVVVESVTTLARVAIAGVVEFSDVRSIARVAVAVGGEPETTFETNIAEITVAGEGLVGLGNDGITIAGQNLLDNLELAELDPVFEQLAEQGLTFESVPASVESEAGRARVEGAAFRFRYQAKKNPELAELFDSNPVYQFLPAVPPELGYDEEFLVGHVTATAVAREAGNLGVDLGFGGAGGGALPPPTAGGATPETPGGSDASSPSPEASTPSRPPSPTVAAPPAAPLDGGAPATPEVAASADSDRTGGDPADTTLDLLGADAVNPGVQRMNDLYQLLFLFAIAGAAAPRLLQRANT